MDVGISFFATDETVPPPEFGRMCEERGFESLLLAEHTHIPASRRTDYPAGGKLPREYYRTHDPFVTLASIASVTERLRLGTGICLVIQRDPIVTAKEVASLDVISGGRAIFGVGAGWNLEEMESHGTDPERRFGLMRERVEAIKAIWTEEIADYHGEQVHLEAVHVWPKPLQDPHPPVFIGGNGSGVIERVLRYGDGWMPNNFGDEERLLARVAKLHRLAEERGLPRPLVTLIGTPHDPAALERYRVAGVDRVTSWIPSAEREVVERALDAFAAAAGEFAGAA
jgi:probable F420-dependent oxidoreductase